MTTQFESAYAKWQAVYWAGEVAEGTEEGNLLLDAEVQALEEMFFTPSATGEDFAEKLRIFLRREIATFDDGDRYAEMLIAEAGKATFANRIN